MKHAYLIIAHNQFDVLQKLIDQIDDKRNDIYIHIDGKIRRLPILSSQKSSLVILKNRIRVIWGDISQIKAEYLLLEEASKRGPYKVYHIISGTHCLLKSQDFIHDYFRKRSQSHLLPMPTSRNEIQFKIGKFHFFLKHLVSRNLVINKLYHVLWRICLLPQRGYKRDCSFIAGKASNWCSLCDDDVKKILWNKKKVLCRFRRTFCADEFFIPSILHLNVDYDNSLLYVDFVCSTPRVLSKKEIEMLTTSSNYIFARKVDIHSF